MWIKEPHIFYYVTTKKKLELGAAFETIHNLKDFYYPIGNRILKEYIPLNWFGKLEKI